MDQKNRMRKSRYEAKGTPYKIVNEEVIRLDGKYDFSLTRTKEDAKKHTEKLLKRIKEERIEETAEGMSDYYETLPKPVHEIYQPLPSEIVEELMAIDEGRGHNLTPKKYNIKPIVDVLEAVIRIQKRKLSV